MYRTLRVAIASAAIVFAIHAAPARSQSPAATGVCPSEITVPAQCVRGRDAAGAYYVLAVPAVWNRVLVVHAHGGPELDAPSPARAEADLKRWGIEVNAGYAFAASTYHEPGFAIRSAAADSERVRTIFVDRFGTPRRTILHGQSWGAGVAARAPDVIRVAGRFPYDGILLTSGVLDAGTRSYDFRLDLRAVYEYLCGNHPRPDEAAYPLGTGLPAGSTMTEEDLRARWTACVGTEGARTPEQTARLTTLAAVIRMPPRSLLGHLAWGTFEFRSIAQRYGGSPFGNAGVRYTGSSDDDALNRGVQREAADAGAARRFTDDAAYSANFEVPVFSVHAIHDPTAMVELENVLRERTARAGRSDHLVQAYVDFDQHSYWSDPVYPAALAALVDWIDRGEKPSPETLATRCAAMQAQFKGDCRVVLGYVPQPLDAREPAR